MQTSTGPKTAIVFGGAQGIGYASAERIARNGDRVAIADINGDASRKAAAAIASTCGVDTAFAAVDITDLGAVETAFQEIGASLGPADIVVNTAAIVADKLFVESTPADWHRMVDVCLFGSMNILHTMLPGMRERQFGRGVFLASDSARIGQARLSYYAAAKAGVIALVKSVAQEVGRDGITLNVVSPGATNTELRKSRETTLREQMGDEKYAQREKKVLRMYPLGRIGEPSDIASTVAFLCSPEASWTTGQVLSVNGGFVMP